MTTITFRADLLVSSCFSIFFFFFLFASGCASYLLLILFDILMDSFCVRSCFSVFRPVHFPQALTQCPALHRQQLTPRVHKACELVFSSFFSEYSCGLRHRRARETYVMPRMDMLRRPAVSASLCKVTLAEVQFRVRLSQRIGARPAPV